VSNAFGTVNETKINYITAGSLPVANFTATGTGGPVPYTTSFNATITGFPNATYAWDIDNDGDVDYTGRNITHTYTSYGLYSVNLTTTNMFGTNTSIRSNYIAAGMEPKVSFSGDPLSGKNIVDTQFNDTTVGSPTSWNWSFGDGTWFNTSNESEKDVTHAFVYGTDGIYTVSLTCTNAYGSNTTSHTAYVCVTGVPSSTVIFTQNVSNLSVASATFNGLIIENYTDDVWFEYGVDPAGMTMATKKIRDIEGETNFSKNITLSSLYPGEVYYYRAVSESNGYGDIKLFTVPTPSPEVAGETVPQVFTEERNRFVQLERSNFEFEVIAPIVSAAYTSLWGFWIYGFIWAGIFAAFWLRQEDVTIPTFLYVLLSYTVKDYLPAAWMPFVYGTIIISISGMIYILLRGWRNG
jgi:PKD repeat protein